MSLRQAEGGNSNDRFIKGKVSDFHHNNQMICNVMSFLITRCLFLATETYDIY